VAVDQLDDSSGIAQGADALLDARPVDGIDEPHPAVGDESVRGPLEERRLGRDPGEPDAARLAEPDGRHPSRIS
jgi:hypothetical protein